LIQHLDLAEVQPKALFQLAVEFIARERDDARGLSTLFGPYQRRALPGQRQDGERPGGEEMFLGPAVMREVTWWGIVVANLSATAVMLYYFLSRHPGLARNLLGPWIAILKEGLVAGLIGAVIVAAWFLAYDLAMGDAFKTPLLLGEAIFNNSMTASHNTMGPLIIAYSVIHFLAFIGFGIALAILMAATDREPLIALGALVVFAMFEVFFFGWVTLIDSSLLQQLGWWKIIAANVLALIGMTAYEMRAHRGVILRLQERWAALESEGDEAATPGPRHR